MTRPKVRSSKVNHHHYPEEHFRSGCADHMMADYPGTSKRKREGEDDDRKLFEEMFFSRMFDSSDTSDCSEKLDNFQDENQNNVKTESEGWRQSGNDLYKRAFEVKGNATFQKEMLLEALKHYRKALSSSGIKDNTVSAQKNIATAALGVARTIKGDVKLKLHYSKLAIEYFEKGLELGSSVKPPTWCSSLLATYHQCLQEVIDYVPREYKTRNENIVALEELTSVMSDKYFKAECYLQVAKVIFNKVLLDLAVRDFRSALSGMRDVYQPVERTKMLLAKSSCLNKAYIKSEINILDEDVYLHTCIAESMQAQHFGDKQLQEIKQTEYLNMDMLYEVIDWYKKAIILTREAEVEMEAIALSRLGSVYEDILKLKPRAKENYMRSLQLAHSLHPRTFENEEWYVKARDSVKKFQEEVVEQEDKKWQEARKEYLDQLKDELEILKKKKYDEVPNLLEFLLKTFPPKGKFTLPTNAQLKKYDDEVYDQKKKIFMKVLFAYHPDKQNPEEHGQKWSVLCEEISKVLNNKYSANFKGGL